MEDSRTTWGQKVVLSISALVLAALALGVIMVVVLYTVGISYIRTDGARVTIKGDVTTTEWPNGNGPVCADCKPWSEQQSWSSQEFEKRIIWVEAR